MKNILKVLMFTPILFLTGCMGQQASFSEKLHDSYAFTAADSVSGKKCITLTRSYAVTAGSVTYTLPAGKYIAKRKNDTGYFYYAPSSVSASNWLVSSPQEGIYLNNQMTQGNIMGRNVDGYSDRPIRGAVLPSSVFQYIRPGC